jgi:hypothetical protein
MTSSAAPRRTIDSKMLTFGFYETGSIRVSARF